MTTRAYIIDKINDQKFVGEGVSCDGDPSILGLMLKHYYNYHDDKVKKLLTLGDLDSVGKTTKPSPIFSKFRGGENELDDYLQKHSKNMKQFHALHDEAYSDTYTTSYQRDWNMTLNPVGHFKSYQDVIKNMPYFDCGYIYLYQNHQWYEIFDGDLGDLTKTPLTIDQALHNIKVLPKIVKMTLKSHQHQLANNFRIKIIDLKYLQMSKTGLNYVLNDLLHQTNDLYNLYFNYSKKVAHQFQHLYSILNNVQVKIEKVASIQKAKRNVINQIHNCLIQLNTISHL